MLKNIIGELRIMKELNIKPNFSALEREYGINRHTIKKYYDNDSTPLRKHKKRSSMWDSYHDEIVELLEKPGVSKKAVYNYFLNKYSNEKLGTYSGFKSYTLRLGINNKIVEKPHVLYETEPGVQIQTDWKESLKMELITGEVIEFNVYSATLGYSRMHVFIYSPTKTEDDFMRCTLEVFRRIGGTTVELKTDNMSAIVNIKGKERKIHTRIKQFMEDINVKLELCKVRTPETKGKDENSNKFLNWLAPYQGKIKDELELIHIIEEVITSQANSQVNTGTNMKPCVLFAKEKEYLRPLNNTVLLDNYLNRSITSCVVPATLLVYFEGSKYSVPSNMIGKRVELYRIEEKLFIYHKKQLVAIHNISQNKVNYNKEHYIEALSMSLSKTNIDDIDEMAQKNLKQLSKLGGKGNEY